MFSTMLYLKVYLASNNFCDSSDVRGWLTDERDSQTQLNTQVKWLLQVGVQLA